METTVPTEEWTATPAGGKLAQRQPFWGDTADRADSAASSGAWQLLVDTAIEEIRRFAGDDVTFYDAAALLPRWQHYDDLGPDQRAAVYRAFPQRAER